MASYPASAPPPAAFCADRRRCCCCCTTNLARRALVHFGSGYAPCFREEEETSQQRKICTLDYF